MGRRWVDDAMSHAPPQPYRFELHEGMVDDLGSGLTWSQQDVTDASVSYTQAHDACRRLRLGGYHDWRLPTCQELLTLLEDRPERPAVDAKAFPSIDGSWYWTSTATALADTVWVVSLQFGISNDGIDNSLNRVRAVRGIALAEGVRSEENATIPQADGAAPAP
jgi:hypothetical protein